MASSASAAAVVVVIARSDVDRDAAESVAARRCREHPFAVLQVAPAPAPVDGGTVPLLPRIGT
jgi:hypothetical protein